MDYFSILILLLASIAFSKANVIYGAENRFTKELASKNAYFGIAATVTFNEDNTYDLIIHKVVVLFVRDTLQVTVTGGGPGHSFVTIHLMGISRETNWAAVYIYGRMKRGRVRDIKKGAVTFSSDDNEQSSFSS